MSARRAAELSPHHVALTRALLHLVEREPDPLASVDRVLAHVVDDASASEYREALDRALASNIALARLGPEYHPESIVRRFLSEVRRRLASTN